MKLISPCGEFPKQDPRFLKLIKNCKKHTLSYTIRKIEEISAEINKEYYENQKKILMEDARRHRVMRCVS